MWHQLAGHTPPDTVWVRQVAPQDTATAAPHPRSLLSRSVPLIAAIARRWLRAKPTPSVSLLGSRQRWVAPMRPTPSTTGASSLTLTGTPTPKTLRTDRLVGPLPHHRRQNACQDPQHAILPRQGQSSRHQATSHRVATIRVVPRFRLSCRNSHTRIR